MSDAPALTKEEQSAIRRLESLARVWPDSLWLFSAGGLLCVMKKDAAGRRLMREEYQQSWPEAAYDPDSQVATILIENDGGDW